MKTIGSHLASFLQSRKPGPRQVAPFVRYMVVLVAVTLLYGWLFHVLMAWEGQQHSWFTGIYWALTVMSTLGFGDITFTTDLGRLFSSVVLLTGILMLLVILPFLFIRLVYVPWLEEQSRRHFLALRRIPDDVSGHVVICANDPIALGLVKRLELVGIRSWVVEPDPAVASQMHDAGTPVITGDVDAVETYVAARVERARLVFANAGDTVNTNIVLTVRELSPSVPIAALAQVEDSVDILELSGATHVFPLARRLGEQLANRVSVGQARANVIGRIHTLVLAEFPVHDTPLQGRTIRTSGLREQTGLSIAGVWDHGRLLPAQPDLVLSPLSVPVVVGAAHQLRALDTMLVTSHPNVNPIIVIGGGKVGRAAAQALKRRDVPVHVVERSRELEPKIAGIPDRLVLGDAADRAVLSKAGIEAAPSILLTTHDDAMNVYLTVYCRRLNPEARILTRVTHERNVEAIQRAGADFVLSYASLGIQTAFAAVQGRELIVLGEGVDLFYVPLPGGLAGKTLAETEIGARTGLCVIAVQRGGQVETSPAPSERLVAGSALVALGSAEQRRTFDRVYT